MCLLYVLIKIAFISTLVITAGTIIFDSVIERVASCEIERKLCNHIADNSNHKAYESVHTLK